MSTYDPRDIRAAATFLASLFADGRERKIEDIVAFLGMRELADWRRSPYHQALAWLVAEHRVTKDDSCWPPMYQVGAAIHTEPSRRFEPTPEQAHTDPLLAAAYQMGMTEVEVIALQAEQLADLRKAKVQRMIDALPSPLRFLVPAVQPAARAPIEATRSSAAEAMRATNSAELRGLADDVAKGDAVAIRRAIYVATADDVPGPMPALCRLYLAETEGSR